MKHQSKKCGYCNGTGHYLETRRCFMCGGAGIVPRKRGITVSEYFEWWNSVKDKVKIYGEPVQP